jgi:type I restriction enzyme R subunit
MQTIARANRVSEGKSNGLIIDYIGIVKALREALASYTVNPEGKDGNDPTIDKDKLIARIQELIKITEEFLEKQGFLLESLVSAQKGTFEQLSLIQDAENAVCETQETKNTFQAYASELDRLSKYLDRNDIDTGTKAHKDAIIAVYMALQQKKKHVDNTDLMVEINNVINDYVVIQPQTESITPSKRFDISSINFDLLVREFSKKKKQNLVMRDIEYVIEMRLNSMVAANPGRADYLKRYQEIISDYNSEQDRATIEKTFKDLMDLANSMSDEQQRYVREGFTSDEELSIYDLLFSDKLSPKDIKEIKKVAVDLLTRIKAKITELDHWTDKQETKAAVDNLIRDTLWEELPESYDEVRISMYRQKIYEYIYLRYGVTA